MVLNILYKKEELSSFNNNNMQTFANNKSMCLKKDLLVMKFIVEFLVTGLNNA